MIIDIVKPYIMSGQRIITLDNITITLQEDEIKELFNELDYELNYGGLREDLIREIDKLKDEVRYLKGELSIDQEDDED